MTDVTFNIECDFTIPDASWNTAPNKQQISNLLTNLTLMNDTFIDGETEVTFSFIVTGPPTFSNVGLAVTATIPCQFVADADYTVQQLKQTVWPLIEGKIGLPAKIEIQPVVGINATWTLP